MTVAEPTTVAPKGGVPLVEMRDIEVSFGGVRAVDGSFYGYMTKFTAPDGTVIELDLSGAVGGESKK